MAALLSTLRNEYGKSGNLNQRGSGFDSRTLSMWQSDWIINSSLIGEETNALYDSERWFLSFKHRGKINFEKNRLVNNRFLDQLVHWKELRVFSFFYTMIFNNYLNL